MASLFQADIHSRGLALDPRTKLFCLITIVFFVLGGMGTLAPAWMNAILSVLPLVLLCAVKQFKRALAYGAVYAAALLLLTFAIPGMQGALRYIVAMVCLIVAMLAPSIIMGAYLFASTTVSEFIAAMERMHVTNKITIPLSVMFRFFPTVVEEFLSINSAMKMRDIRLGGRNAAKMVEYVIVPLLVCSANIGSELSQAALTRGLSADAKRTNICRIGFHAADLALFALMACYYAVWLAGMLHG